MTVTSEKLIKAWVGDAIISVFVRELFLTRLHPNRRGLSGVLTSNKWFETYAADVLNLKMDGTEFEIFVYEYWKQHGEAGLKQWLMEYFEWVISKQTSTFQTKDKSNDGTYQ